MMVDNHEFAAQVYVSSIWIERAGKWLCRFRQGTPSPSPMRSPILSPRTERAHLFSSMLPRVTWSCLSP